MDGMQVGLGSLYGYGFLYSLSNHKTPMQRADLLLAVTDNLLPNAMRWD